jgi:hypothetical protein
MKKSIILAGWDYDDLNFCKDTILKLKKYLTIYSYPYNYMPKNSNIFNSCIDRQLSILCYDEYTALDKVESKQFLELDMLDAADFENIMLQIERTVYNSLPLYKQLRLIKSLILTQKDKLAGLGQPILLFRDWPHLFADYTLYLAAQLYGFPSFVLQPVKGISRGFRKEWNPFNSTFYTVYRLSSRQYLHMPDAPKYIYENTMSIFINFIKQFSSTEQPARNNYEINSSRQETSLKGTRATFNIKPNLLWLRSNIQSNLVANVAFNKIKKVKEEYNLILHSQAQMAESMVANKKPYIFFPLPKQPEANITPYFKCFHDPAVWIAILTNNLPEEVHIVCKEHPDTFRFPLGICDHFLNDRSFPRYYNWYIDLFNCFNSRLRFFDTSKKFSDILQDNMCTSVFTMNGSCVYDCLSAGKPLIVPSQHWISELSGVYGINAKSSSLRQDLGQFLNESLSFTNHDFMLDKSAHKLFTNVIRGYNPGDNQTDILFRDIMYLANSVDNFN